MTDFETTVALILSDGLKSLGIETIQVNIGRVCNLACNHCHLECSPERSELMTEETMDLVLAVVRSNPRVRIEITGGSPEFHPRLREFIEALRNEGLPVQMRTNLVALVEGDDELAPFLRDRSVELVGSLPCYLEENVARQRGEGV
ncbi:MAG: radical SAM protein, partial [Smithellaceae bacterium]|nr:radical SAM protein [Smithellaceae bacterium]